jgi:phosphoribosylglycinamide formyltransferase 1
MHESRMRIGVLASGRGSNLQAIIDAIEEGTLEAILAVVISNKAEAPALERARKHGTPAVFLDPKVTADREAYDRDILEQLRKYDVELVALAGYMKIVTSVLIEAYANRMMNIHPSLLPAFPGLAAQRQALDWGVKVTGCTVHFVTERVDTGPIIRQAALPILEDDTEESLAARILVEEHRIYPQALQLFAEKRLTVEGRQVQIRENKSPHGASLLASDS